MKVVAASCDSLRIRGQATGSEMVRMAFDCGGRVLRDSQPGRPCHFGKPKQPPYETFRLTSVGVRISLVARSR
jgi:hypothetical protein